MDISLGVSPFWFNGYSYRAFFLKKVPLNVWHTNVGVLNSSLVS